MSEILSILSVGCGAQKHTELQTVNGFWLGIDQQHCPTDARIRLSFASASLALPADVFFFFSSLDEVIRCGKSPMAIIRYICWTFWAKAISLEPLSQVSWCKDALCCGHPSHRKSADYQQRQIAGNPSSMTAIPAVFSASFGAFVLSGGPRRVRLGLCLLHFALDKFALFFSACYKRAEKRFLSWTVTAVNVSGFILNSSWTPETWLQHIDTGFASCKGSDSGEGNSTVIFCFWWRLMALCVCVCV